MTESRTLRGISLHRRHSGERSRYVVLLTETNGRVQALAHGMHKPASSLRAATEPLNEGLYRIVRRRGFDLLVEWQPVNHFLPVHHDPRALALALYCVQFPLRLLPPEQSDPQAFFLLKNILLTLCDTKHYDICRIVYELGFLRIAGHAVEFAHCVRCGVPAENGSWSFNVSAGGPECADCSAPGGSSRNMPLGADAMNAGRNFGKLADAFSSGTFEDGAPASEPLALALSEAARDVPALALRRLRNALGAFLRFHFNEPVDKWLAVL